MAKIVFTLEDTEEGVLVKTDGLVAPNGTTAERVAYMVALLLTEAAGIPFESVATEVRPSGGEKN